jgi:2-dehydropantoate 2-reductase
MIPIGAELGVPTPALARLVELIHDLEQGKRALSVETMDQMVPVCS